MQRILKNWLDTVDQAAKKYNQCLQYCRQGGEDLAIIQLKKIVSEQPDFLRAFQLLALLYLHTSQYAKARQVLRTAQRLDTTDPVTLGYIYELNRMHKKRTSGQKDVKGQQTVSYKLGNETIIKPVETKDTGKGHGIYHCQYCHRTGHRGGGDVVPDYAGCQ